MNFEELEYHSWGLVGTLSLSWWRNSDFCTTHRWLLRSLTLLCGLIHLTSGYRIDVPVHGKSAHRDPFPECGKWSWIPWTLRATHVPWLIPVQLTCQMMKFLICSWLILIDTTARIVPRSVSTFIPFGSRKSKISVFSSVSWMSWSRNPTFTWLPTIRQLNGWGLQLQFPSWTILILGNARRTLILIWLHATIPSCVNLLLDRFVERGTFILASSALKCIHGSRMSLDWSSIRKSRIRRVLLFTTKTWKRFE